MLSSYIRGILLLLFAASFAQIGYPQDREAQLKQLKKDVEHLASDKMKGREAGTKHAKDAADYIAKRFKDIGLSTLDNGTYFQTFNFPKTKDPHTGTESEEKVEGMNVIGRIFNDSKYNNVTIGAHYDHLGMGGPGSFSETEAIHNGADDNASGVALMLNLAERLKSSKFRKNNYIFIAFTGEEKGLYGSNYYLKHPPSYLNTMNYMINLDMVGRLNPEKGIVVNAVGTSPIWKSALEHADTMNLKYVTSESGVGPSDHTSFYMKDIPAIHLFTGSHEDYHRPTDDADKINYEGMLTISDLVYSIVGYLNTKLKLAFTRTVEEENSAAIKFKVTLGVIPDYLFDGKGMRIDGVKEGRPAFKAGIKAGDIVISIGEQEVINLNSYMVGLNKLEEGQKARVKVQREDQVLEFDVQF